MPELNTCTLLYTLCFPVGFSGGFTGYFARCACSIQFFFLSAFPVFYRNKTRSFVQVFKGISVLL